MALFLAFGGLAIVQAVNLVEIATQIIETAGDTGTAETANELAFSLRRFLVSTGLFLIVTTILITGLLYGLFQSFSRPLGVLFDSIKRWSGGDINHRVTLSGEDELTQLADLLNRVAERQQNWTQILERTMTDHARELEHRAFHLETSVAVAQRITSILDRDSLLQQVTELIRQRYELSYVGLFLANPNRKFLTLQASTRSPKEDKVIQMPIEEHSLIGWVAHHRRPGLSNNLLEEKRRDGRFESDMKSLSELALPLTIGRDLVGVLDLHSNQVSAFAREDLPMFQSLADQVAIAIKNASIYESEHTERQLSETLQRVGRELNSTLNMTEVQELILQSTNDILQYDNAAIFLVNNATLTVGAQKRAKSTAGEPTYSPINLKQVPDQFPLKQAIQNAKPIIVQDITQSKEWFDIFGLPQNGSWLGVPLIHEDKSLGILSIARNTPFSITDQDLALASAIAAQAAIALENARLYERIKRFSEQLEYEVRRRTQALQTAYNQLEQLDEAKTNFISIASHELRTPLTVIKGYSQILTKAPEIVMNEQYANLINGIITGTRRLQNVVDTMLDMARIENRSLTVLPEPITLFEMINDVLYLLREAIEERHISIEISPQFRRLPTIYADFDGLQKVFTQLIINAIKYTPDGGEIHIDGHAWERSPAVKSWPQKGVEIIIADNGIGIKKENLQAIFNKFFQTGKIALHSSGKTKFKGGGPGLGLAIAKGIVEAHRGLIWAESPGYDEEALLGSAFHIVLPILQETAEAAAVPSTKSDLLTNIQSHFPAK